jgi:uracil-DNA glycosylase family 4
MPRQNPRVPKPDACAPCSLARLGFGFAPPIGPEGAPLTFIGESLGYEEAVSGQPFYGAAGGQLSRQCTRAGIDRAHVRIHNCVSCQPPNDYLVGAPWEEHAIATCRQYLQPVLEAVPTNGVVVPLGATALGAILGLRGQSGITVRDFHGTVTRSVDDRYWVVPTFHPAFLQRGAMNLTDVVTQDLRLASRITQTGFTRSPCQLMVDPHPEWFATWVADHLAKVARDPETTHLAIDTEFVEKAGGIDESEIMVDIRSLSPLTRINGANSLGLGWTVPYREPYRSIARTLLEQTAKQQGWIWMWNKYADLAHLWADGVQLPNEIVIDGMWLWHYLQSDLPKGLGFVAAMASDFGPWKHWAKIPEREGEYAAGDGVQTYRTVMWLLKAAYPGVWNLFLRDWHERDCYVLRPAFEVGTPINKPALEAFHADLQEKLARILAELKTTTAEGVLKPKDGYRQKPKGGECPTCSGFGALEVDCDDGEAMGVCRDCGGTGERAPTPPPSIMNPPKKGGGEAKQHYMTAGVHLIEKQVQRTVLVCTTCDAQDIQLRHRCKPTLILHVLAGLTKAGKLKKPKVEKVPRDPHVVEHTLPVTRWFWRLPFNPDAPAQVLAYLESQGIEAPVDKKRRTKTTNKKALAELAKQHADDPFFKLQLDWKAVQKVDSTYAVGSLRRLDDDDRLHPEFLPLPSTFRDSARNPNLQNVVADKAGPEGLASGFRRTVEARDGIPPGATVDQVAAWEARWT